MDVVPMSSLLKHNALLSRVRGVSLHTLRFIPDPRGSLSVVEFEKEIPFKPSRFFLIYNVPSTEIRGEHAHIQCKQFLINIKGTVNVIVDDGYTREEFILNQSNVGLYIPQMIWGIQYRYSIDAMLLVFASEHYDAKDYIRDYLKFLEIVRP